MKGINPQIISRIHTTGSDHHISRTDYYQMFTSVLMVILGVIILSRSVIAGITLTLVLVGGGFLALGCYRLKFVIKFLRER
ncbi:MAG: hypothetical protein ABII96_08755 [Candidatus Zixiibacteriota bacterium]